MAEGTETYFADKFTLPSTLTSFNYLDLDVQPYDSTTTDASYKTFPMTYALYDEDSIFDPWKSWVRNNRETASTNEEQNAVDYSGYAIVIECDLSACSVSQISCGCCLQDKSGQEGGAYCLVLNSAQDGGDTYFLTHD